MGPPHPISDWIVRNSSNCPYSNKNKNNSTPQISIAYQILPISLSLAKPRRVVLCRPQGKRLNHTWNAPPAYIEFRIGDYQHELGIIDSKYAPPTAAAGPGGVVAYWHVDDVAAALERLTA